MSAAELIQWHEREAAEKERIATRVDADPFLRDDYEDEIRRLSEEAAFHRSAAETVRRLVDELEGWNKVHRALAGAPTDEEKRA